MSQATPSTAEIAPGRGPAAQALPFVWDLGRSHGSYLHDARTGRELLDLFGFGGSRALSFDHPKLVEPAFLERLARAALFDSPGAAACRAEGAAVAELFGAVPLGGAFAHLCFADCASVALQVAVQAAQDWKALRVEAGQRGAGIILFRGGSHGCGGFVLSGAGPEIRSDVASLHGLDGPRIDNPVARGALDDAAREEIDRRELATLHAIEEVLDASPNGFAAILVEPVQRRSGDLYFRTEFLHTLRALTLQRELLLIFDEVQTGFGVSGRWWDFENHGVRPDLLLFGDRAQASGVAAGERLGSAPFARAAGAGHGGRLADLVRSARVVEIVQEEDLLTSATAMGAYLLRLLRDVSDAEPAVTGVRGRGLMAAFDLPTRDERDRVVQGCLDSELLVMPTGERTICLHPALDITADAIGRSIAQLDAGLRYAYGRRS